MSNPVIKHQKNVTIPDGTDTDVVRPSDWNADHQITQTTGRLLGRVSAGAGATEELTPEQSRTLMALGTAALVDAEAKNFSVDDTIAQLGLAPEDRHLQKAIEALANGYRLRGPKIFITSSQTYTPDPDVAFITVEALGGGAGGRTASGDSGSGRIRGAGGAGGYSEKSLSPPVELTITIGAGGSPDSAGGNTTVVGDGVSLSANGGQTGANQESPVRVITARGGRGGGASGGDFNLEGQSGTGAMANAEHDNAHIGTGGSTKYGSGGRSDQAPGGSQSGHDGQGYGSGGSGSYQRVGSSTTQLGGAGADGVVVITEYVGSQ